MTPHLQPKLLHVLQDVNSGGSAANFRLKLMVEWWRRRIESWQRQFLKETFETIFTSGSIIQLLILAQNFEDIL